MVDKVETNKFGNENIEKSIYDEESNQNLSKKGSKRKSESICNFYIKY